MDGVIDPAVEVFWEAGSGAVPEVEEELTVSLRAGKPRVYDARDFGSFNRVYMECFGSHRPARSTVESRLMIDAKVEIDVTAYKPR